MEMRKEIQAKWIQNLTTGGGLDLGLTGVQGQAPG